MADFELQATRQKLHHWRASYGDTARSACWLAAHQWNYGPDVALATARDVRQKLLLRPDDRVLEIGAGSGLMAADMLNELEALDCLPERYEILEVSADLRERQLATLTERAPRHVARVTWLNELPAVTRGVIVANEVLDALPTDRFRMRSGCVQALGVAWTSGCRGPRRCRCCRRWPT